MTDYGAATERKIGEIVATCRRYGHSSIIALAGVPGTGKSMMALAAAQRLTGTPLTVREVQFHQSFSYEQFIEGLHIGEVGATEPRPGVFLEWNSAAHDDPQHEYVLLIEELTRANVSAVLGELMTYLECRDRAFFTIYSRTRVHVAKNLTVLATFNPTDRSAITIDAALIRRLRIVSCPPDVGQLADMLRGRPLAAHVIAQIERLFDACKDEFGDGYEESMPFGHGIFDSVQREEDLYALWKEKLRHMLQRPPLEPHPFMDVIKDHYPWWRDPQYRMPPP